VKYLFIQNTNTENEIQSIGSLFSPSAESAGTQMGIGADMFLYYLELLGIGWDLIRKT